MELTNQVSVLQDEVKLLKGEIKSILKEIRTAVLSRDNPFAAGLDAMAAGGAAAAAPRPQPVEPENVLPQPSPEPAPVQQQAQPVAIQQGNPQASQTQTTQPAAAPQQAQPMVQQPYPQAAPQLMTQQAYQQPVPQPAQPAGPPPAWSTPIPEPQAAPEPFWPPEPTAAQQRLAALSGWDTTAAGLQRGTALEQVEHSMEEAGGMQPSESREPIPIRQGQTNVVTQAPTAEVPDQHPTWSLAAIAGLAVWAEDALTTLGARRFQFVLELASFADLLSEDAREVLIGLVEGEPPAEQDERPFNVNECLVVLRQLEAIVHGEKIVRLPRRKGIRHRRIR